MEQTETVPQTPASPPASPPAPLSPPVPSSMRVSAPDDLPTAEFDNLHVSTADEVRVDAPPTAPIDAGATIREYLRRMDRDERWAERTVYEERDPSRVTMVAMIKFNVDYALFALTPHTWDKDPDATRDTLLRFANETLAAAMPLIAEVHRVALAMPVHQKLNPGTQYPTEIERLAQLMAIPCAGMAQVRETQADGTGISRYGVQFRRMPMFMPARPSADAFDDLLLVNFVDGYRMATCLSIVAGVLVHALDQHASRHEAALAQMDPPRSISGYARNTYEACMVTFAPFLVEGCVHYNAHGRALIKRVNAVSAGVMRELRQSPGDDVHAIAMRLATAAAAEEGGEGAKKDGPGHK